MLTRQFFILSIERAQKALEILEVKHSVSHLPKHLKRWSVLKSPFKWKKHQRAYEKVTHTHMITFESDVLTAKKLIKFLRDTAYPGVGLRIKSFVFEPLEWYYNHPYNNMVDIDVQKKVD